MMLAILAAAACLPAGGERILARDLAQVWPAFAAVSADLPIAYAPAPGAVRHFRAAELARMAARHGVAPTEGEICFERPTAPLEAGQVLEALQAELAMPEARISLDEFSRQAAPRGDIVFPRATLRAPSPGTSAVLWRGYVRYAGDRRFPIWARVRIAAPLTRVRTTAVLRAGEPVAAAQVALEPYEGFPLPGRDAGSVAEVIGRKPRRTIPAGAPVPLAALEPPREVERGDTVRVEVSSGATRLALNARAESAGGPGQTVRVRNPETKRAFAARVAGKGVVTVNAGESR